MEEKHCQCCCMPIGDTDDLYGTNEDGSKSKDYCKYCYDNGKFTADCTMEEMIDFCVPHMVEAHKEMSKEEARKMMMDVFPHLKRWKKD